MAFWTSWTCGCDTENVYLKFSLLNFYAAVCAAILEKQKENLINFQSHSTPFFLPFINLALTMLIHGEPSHENEGVLE